MTQNQINYQKNLETERHNRIQELETERNNRATEGENRRSHLAGENLKAIELHQDRMLRSKALDLEQRGQDLNYEVGSRQAGASETNAAASMIRSKAEVELVPSKIAANYGSAAMVDVQREFANIKQGELDLAKQMSISQQFVNLANRDKIKAQTQGQQAQNVLTWKQIGTYEWDALRNMFGNTLFYLNQASSAAKYGVVPQDTSNPYITEEWKEKVFAAGNDVK